MNRTSAGMDVYTQPRLFEKARGHCTTFLQKRLNAKEALKPSKFCCKETIEKQAMTIGLTGTGDLVGSDWNLYEVDLG